MEVQGQLHKADREIVSMCIPLTVDSVPDAIRRYCLIHTHTAANGHLLQTQQGRQSRVSQERATRF